MAYLRQLDTSRKLLACFAVLLCLSTALTLWLLGQMGQLTALTARTGQKLSAAQGSFAALRTWAYCCALGLVAAGAALALWLRAEVARPAAEAVAMARRMAGGDLGTRIAEGTADPLLCTLQDMNDKLARMVIKVRSGTEGIAGSAGQIAAGAMELAARGGEQAALLAAAARAAETLNAALLDHAEQARQASEQARLACAAAAAAARDIRLAAGEPAAAHANQALDDVLASMRAVAAMAGDMAGAGAAQAAGLAQLRKTFAAIEQAAQHDALLLERTAATAASMRDEAGNLSRASAIFSLGKNCVLAGPALHLVSSNPHRLVRLHADGRPRVRQQPVMRAVVSNAPSPVIMGSPAQRRGNAMRRKLDWEEF